jgi:hypothetical protein
MAGPARRNVPGPRRTGFAEAHPICEQTRRDY